MELLEQIKMNAIRHNKRIVLPEGTEERTLRPLMRYWLKVLRA